MNSSIFANTVDQILTKHGGENLHELKITYPYPKLIPNITIEHLINIASSAFSSLATLRLHHASLSSHTIHALLSNSPNLSKLSIVRAFIYSGQLEISGGSIKLKHLELIDNPIEFLEISAPNLESFSFGNRSKRCPTTTRFKSTPLLTRVSISEMLTLDRDYYVLFPQLHTLTLTLTYESAVAFTFKPHVLAFKALKHLHITLATNWVTGLWLFLKLFKASPCLSRLSLDLGPHICPAMDHLFKGAQHEFLEEVEIIGFGGSNEEVKLLMCIAWSAPSLQKIIIHPGLYKTKLTLSSCEERVFTNQETVRRAVKELSSRLPQKELRILLEGRIAPNPTLNYQPADWKIF